METDLQAFQVWKIILLRERRWDGEIIQKYLLFKEKFDEYLNEYINITKLKVFIKHILVLFIYLYNLYIYV